VFGVSLFTDCVCLSEGIKIIGGVLDWETSEKNYGIYVKKILSGGLAAADGQYLWSVST